MKKIVVKNLSHTFTEIDGSKTIALHDVSINFPIGKITALIGPSGSGKTVLLKHLNGLLLPTQGSVNVFNFNLSSNQKKINNIKELRKKVGFLFQFPEQQLFEETVEKDVLFGPNNFDINHETAMKNIYKSFDLLGLSRSFLPRQPLELSGGEKRKVAIAGVLSSNPDLILIDQLGRGLDIKSQKQFLNIIQTLKNQKKTFICAANDLDAVLEIADLIVYLDQGKVKLIETPEKLFFNQKILTDNKIKLPKTIAFLNKYQAAGGDIKGINFRKKEDLIHDLINKLKTPKK